MATLRLFPRYGRLGASSRLRMMQFVPILEAAGLKVSVAPLIDDALLQDKYVTGRYELKGLWAAYGRRARDLFKLSGKEIAWIEKEALPWFPAFVSRWLIGKQLCVLEYDDAIFHNYDRHPRRLVRMMLGRTIDVQMRHAALVIAGNSYLAARAAAAGAKRIEVVPTVIDLDRYVPKTIYRSNGPVRIVWIGSPSTAQYLTPLVPVLQRLAREMEIVFRVIGGDAPAMSGVVVESVSWNETSEAAALAECDIGVMPLPDTPWEHGKCGYKLVQYMACGLPTVASPVGANNDITDAGITGLLAADEAAWFQALKLLAVDQAMRERLGCAGRAKVCRELSLQAQGPRLLAMLTALEMQR